MSEDSSFVPEQVREAESYYESYLEPAFPIVSSGKPFTIKLDDFISAEEVTLKSLKGVDGKSRYDWRQEIFAGMIYDRIISLQGSSLEVVKSLSQKVRDPLLDAAFMSFGRLNGIKGTSKEEFVADIDLSDFSQVRSRKPYLFLRPLVLLDVLNKRTDLAAKLDEGSSYFPHLLFRDRKVDFSEVESDLAERILDSCSTDLAKVLAESRKFLGSTSSSKSKSNWLDESYILPPRICLEWRNNVSASDVDDVFGDQEVKREVYNFLADINLLRPSVLKSNGYEFSLLVGERKSRKKSFAHTSWKEYGFMLDSLRNYGINQLLFMWDGSNGEFVDSTYISRTAFLRPSIVEQKDLEVEIYMGKQAESSKQIFRFQDFKYRNTKKALPVLARILDRLCVGAENPKAEKLWPN